MVSESLTICVQGPVARSLVSANRWLRDIKLYRFPWYLTLVSTNHASSNPGQEGIALTHSVTLILIYIIHNQWDLTFSFTATKIRPKPTSQSPTPLSYWQNGKEMSVKNCNNSVNCKLHLIRALFKKHAAFTNKRRLRRGLGFGLANIWRIRNVTPSKNKWNSDCFSRLLFTICKWTIMHLVLVYPLKFA